MNNDIHVFSSTEGLKEFVRSSIESSSQVLEHYDFVINDISSTISDSQLEATKQPALEFLLKMRKQWANFKTDLEVKLQSLDKR